MFPMTPAHNTRPTYPYIVHNVALCTLVACFGFSALGCGDEEPAKTTPEAFTPVEGISVQVWADNWFAMYVDGEEVAEDSVSITTERSFNKESFVIEQTPPFQVSVIIKDFIEDDSGLEYIGDRNQQMGDGGFIAQFLDGTTGAPLLVSNAQWKCSPIHRAPLNKDCEDSADPITACQSDISGEPDGWKDAGFDDSTWENATEYSVAAVSPKDGYDEVAWDASAKLIWTSDLETDNTLLCRISFPAQ